MSSSKPCLTLLLSMVLKRAIHPSYQVQDSDDDEDETFRNLMALEQAIRTAEKRPKPVRLINYAELVVPTYSITTFRSHFRMTPAAVTEIENMLSPIIARQGPIGNLTIPPRKQILSVIWLLATPDSYRSVGEQFAMNKSTLHACFRRVIYSLCGIAKQQIYWPQGVEADDIKLKFERLGGLPNVIGAIDGCQIEIDAPKEESAAYRTGKKKYAIQLQAVCTAELVLTDVFAGYPGSVHDIRVLKNSPLFRDHRQIFIGDEYIVGDKAYPVCTWCIPPYKNYGNISEGELAFNTKLSKTRQPIERCFCLLKGRFRRLKHLVMYRTDEIPLAIMACCVLHNICLRGLHDENEHIIEYIEDGSQMNVENADIVHNTSERENIEGIRKRNNLKMTVVGII